MTIRVDPSAAFLIEAQVLHSSPIRTQAVYFPHLFACPVFRDKLKRLFQVATSKQHIWAAKYLSDPSKKSLLGRCKVLAALLGQPYAVS